MSSDIDTASKGYHSTLGAWNLRKHHVESEIAQHSCTSLDLAGDLGNYSQDSKWEADTKANDTAWTEHIMPQDSKFSVQISFPLQFPNKRF